MDTTMDTTAFETALKADGYADIETKSVPANVANALHSHDYAVRILMLEGELTIGRDGVAQAYRAGDTISVDAGCEHTELYGPAGGRLLVGRKRAA